MFPSPCGAGIFAVPDLLYARELANLGGAEVVARGLCVEELTAEELTVAQEVRGKYQGGETSPVLLSRDRVLPRW